MLMTPGVKKAKIARFKNLDRDGNSRLLTVMYVNDGRSRDVIQLPHIIAEASAATVWRSPVSIESTVSFLLVEGGGKRRLGLQATSCMFGKNLLSMILDKVFEDVMFMSGFMAKPSRA